MTVPELEGEGWGVQVAGSYAWGLVVAEQSGQRLGWRGELWVPGQALPSLAA